MSEMRAIMIILGIISIFLANLLISCTVALAIESPVEKHCSDEKFFCLLMHNAFSAKCTSACQPLRTIAKVMLRLDYCIYRRFLYRCTGHRVADAGCFYNLSGARQFALSRIAHASRGEHYRGRKKTIRLKKEIAMIARVVEAGFMVVLFPERTTANGYGSDDFAKVYERAKSHFKE